MEKKEQKQLHKADKETDDYSLSRVSPSSRMPTWKLILIQLGGLATISQFMLGAQLGDGMSSLEAFLSVTVGSLLLQFISIGIGIAGQKEGLPMGMLSKWAGFGTLGSGILSLFFTVSMIGWFGIQNSVFAQGITTLMKRPEDFGLVAVLTGLAVTLIVIFGVKALSWTASIAVPGFILLIGICAYRMLRTHSLVHLATMSAPGKPLTFTAGVTLVTGSFIIGCIVMPDFTRFAKSPKDVCWMTVFGLFCGEIATNAISVLLAHAVGTPKIMPIIYDLSGVFGTVLVILSSVKINDENLYSSSLDTVNVIRQFFHKDWSRGLITFVIGAFGTIASVTGIINKFQSFLTILGTVFPPVAGIMFIDYFILKRSRKDLASSRAKGKLPKHAEIFNPVTIISWIAGASTGFLVHWGISSLNSIIVTAIVYYVGMKLFYSHKYSKED